MPASSSHSATAYGPVCVHTSAVTRLEGELCGIRLLAQSVVTACGTVVKRQAGARVCAPAHACQVAVRSWFPARAPAPAVPQL